MRILVDAQLPPALAQLLREHGHEADHVTDIVTKDEDFSNMIAHGGEAPSVVWVRIGNTRRTVLLAWFEPLIDEIVRLIEDGQRLIELR